MATTNTDISNSLLCGSSIGNVWRSAIVCRINVLSCGAAALLPVVVVLRSEIFDGAALKKRCDQIERLHLDNAAAPTLTVGMLQKRAYQCSCNNAHSKNAHR